MTPTLTPQELRDLADGMEAAYPNAAHDLRRYADDLDAPEPRVWHDIRDIPANVTVEDRTGDEWRLEDETLRVWEYSERTFIDWNFSAITANEYGPFTELIGD